MGCDPFWFVDPENHEQRDEISKITETLLDLKEDVKLRAKVNREGVFAHIMMKNLHPNVFQQLEQALLSSLLD